MKSSATWVRFLTGAGIGAVLLAVAAACGAEEPTPTAAPTPTAEFFEVSDSPIGDVGVGEAEKWEERQGGTLIFGSAKEVTSPHPYTTTSSVDGHTKEATWLEPLLQLTGDGGLAPVLATSWVANEDLTEWTFHLREGVLFHTGQEMTSADVVWSANYVMDANNAARGHGDMAPLVRSVEAVDKYTVKFNMVGSQPAFPIIISDISVLSIIPVGALEPGEIKVSVGTPGTGPFKFDEWVPASKTVVVRFDDYWGGKPYLEKIVFQLIASATGRGNALRTRELQIAERLSPIFAGRVESGDIGAIEVSAATLSGYRRMMFNLDSPIFDDIDVRLAAMYAMDMQKLLDEAFFGLGTLMDAAVPPGSVWDEALRECCPRRTGDPEKARAMLAASSYAGERVRLVVGRGQGEPIGESISRQLREVGFEVDLQVLESGVYDEKQSTGDFDLTPKSASWGGDPVIDGAGRWRCELAERVNNNQSRYCNPELDVLIDNYYGLTDLDDKLVQFKKIATILYDAAVTKHMGWNFTRFFGWNDNVKGSEHRGEGGYTRGPVGGGLWRVYFED